MRHVYGNDGRRGIALIIVLGLVALLMITCVTFSITMRVDRTSSANMRHAVVARFAARTALADAMCRIAEEGGDVWRPDTGSEIQTNLCLADTAVSGDSNGVACASLLSHEMAKYIPSALRWKAEADSYGGVSVSRPKWVPIEVDETTVGRYCYMILDTSSLLDLNYVNTSNRLLGVSANEITPPVEGPGNNAAKTVREITKCDKFDIGANVFKAFAVKKTAADIGGFQSMAEVNFLSGATNNVYGNFSYEPPPSTNDMAFISDDIDEIIDNRDNIIDAFVAARNGWTSIAEVEENLDGGSLQAERYRAFCDYCALVDYVDEDNDPYSESYGKFSAEELVSARPASEAMPLFSSARVRMTIYADVSSNTVKVSSSPMAGVSVAGEATVSATDRPTDPDDGETTTYTVNYWADADFDGVFGNPFICEPLDGYGLVLKFAVSDIECNVSRLPDSVSVAVQKVCDNLAEQLENGVEISAEYGNDNWSFGRMKKNKTISTKSVTASAKLSQDEFNKRDWMASDRFGISMDVYVAAGVTKGGGVYRRIPVDPTAYGLNPESESHGGRNFNIISDTWMKLPCRLNSNNAVVENAARVGAVAGDGAHVKATDRPTDPDPSPTLGDGETIGVYDFWVEAFDPSYSDVDFLLSVDGNEDPKFKAQYRVSTFDVQGGAQTMGLLRLAEEADGFSRYHPSWDGDSENTFATYVMANPRLAKSLGVNMDGIDYRGGSPHADTPYAQLRRFVKNAPLDTVGELGYIQIGPWFTYTLMDHGDDVQNRTYYNTPIPKGSDCPPFHTVLDCFALESGDDDEASASFGKVNLTSVSPPSIASIMSSTAVFNGLPVGGVYSDGKTMGNEKDVDIAEGCLIGADDALKLAAAISASGPYEYLSDIGHLFDAGSSGNALCWPGGNADDSELCYASKIISGMVKNKSIKDYVGEFERESLIRNSAGLFTTRGKSYLVLIRGESFTPFFSLKGLDQGIVGASSTAAAQIWRDTVKDKNGVYPMFVQFFKLMD